jgi:probable addiction module antidote protein
VKKHRTHDDFLAESLQNPAEAAFYLNAAIKENDPGLLLRALSQAAKAHGMTRTAKRTRLSRNMMDFQRRLRMEWDRA